LVQQFHINAPIEMDKSISKGNHSHHCFAKVWVEVAGLGQETKDVAAFFGMTELVDGGNVRRDVCATLDGGLKGTLYGQAACKVILKRRQRDPLLFL
jgi:hypothetical protein